ncbi:hypothetical protein IMZ48_06375 [Candidatus Bathyarchaeota archaeon]|nr:hypothetical protein [Candidatus Bathyarchaeota archaeon]
MKEHALDLTAEKTRRNIDMVRPESRDVMRSEFDKITSTLMDGVTVSQLEDYVCSFAGRARGKDLSEEEQRAYLKRLTGPARSELTWSVPSRYSWIRQQQSFKPPKNYPWGHTLKEKLALAIMRACWNLQVMEDTPYIGETKLNVSFQILSLLLGKDTLPPLTILVDVANPVLQLRKSRYAPSKLPSETAAA